MTEEIDYKKENSELKKSIMILGVTALVLLIIIFVMGIQNYTNKPQPQSMSNPNFDQISGAFTFNQYYLAHKSRQSDFNVQLETLNQAKNVFDLMRAYNDANINNQIDLLDACQLKAQQAIIDVKANPNDANIIKNYQDTISECSQTYLTLEEQIYAIQAPHYIDLLKYK